MRKAPREQAHRAVGRQGCGIQHGSNGLLVSCYFGLSDDDCAHGPSRTHPPIALTDTIDDGSRPRGRALAFWQPNPRRCVHRTARGSQTVGSPAFE